jgi:abhydrolase domain-containing protein 17
MEFNSLIFPHGASSYTAKTFEGNLIYIPRHYHSEESPKHIPIFPNPKRKCTHIQLSTKTEYIPCLYLPYHLGSNKTMLYFHGNSEDLGQVFDFLMYIRSSLCINIAAMEYPAYGIYQAKECTASQILEDARIVFDYFTSYVGIDQDDIFIMGRSIGTGPATYLASKCDLALLILMSGFTSLRAVVKEVAGKIFQYVVKDRFNNLESIKSVSCPVLLIHGLADTTINFNQSKQLSELCVKQGILHKLVTPKQMSHVEMDFEDDFIIPLMGFMKECDIVIRCEKNLIQSDIIRKNFSCIAK